LSKISAYIVPDILGLVSGEESIMLLYWWCRGLSMSGLIRRKALPGSLVWSK